MSTTSSSRPPTAPPNSAVSLADTNTAGLVASDLRPPPGRLPEELHADLRKLRTLAPAPRQEAAAKIWQDARDGHYGTRAERRAEDAQRRLHALPRQLQDDITKLPGLSGQERTEQRTKIRDRALAGEYGRQLQRWTERRTDLWQQD
ncbi:hypothetical protein ACFZAV_16290 [Streptomyces sp. NPDC008343]|uniref:hypothetical protein n=1 Tax=Streptomyces sp. NPDC008343 TaxID=3364828 RepID=UPI0036EC31C5